MSLPPTEHPGIHRSSEWITSTGPCTAPPTTLSSSDLKKYQQSISPRERRCLWCREALINPPTQRQCRNSYVLTCSMKCWNEMANSAPSLFRTTGKPNPAASLHMRARNPMSNPETRDKMAATLRRIGHRPKVQGGNGRGMTEPQQRLLSALPEGWVAEHVCTTGNPARGTHRVTGIPAHYKIDIAHPDKKIAVEIDGASHTSRKRQEQDRRKDEWLSNHGWSVLRFSNQEVLSSISSVMERITSTP